MGACQTKSVSNKKRNKSNEESGEKNNLIQNNNIVPRKLGLEAQRPLDFESANQFEELSQLSSAKGHNS